jgi:hypothetical protein
MSALEDRYSGPCHAPGQTRTTFVDPNIGSWARVRFVPLALFSPHQPVDAIYGAFNLVK